MLFERFEDKGLAQYSYAVGCDACGQIAIVDPRRDIDVYLEFASSRRLRITHVLETHIHADFASGARELAEHAGATHAVSAYDTGEMFQASFRHKDLKDSQRLQIGRVVIEAIHTPGHTPEHIMFLVYDTVRSAAVPQLMLSGDFVFVGSVGRPDLIGEEAKVHLAGQLFDSLQKLHRLPDGLEIHPGHGAGSMCGSGMSARPMSTLGFERLTNPFLDRQLSRDDFIERLLSNLPPFPPYYRRMKVVNAKGARSLNGIPGQRPLPASLVYDRVIQGHIVVDVRDPMAFAGGHIPGAFGIGLGQLLSTWASWVVPYDTPLVIVASDPSKVPDAVRALIRVGLDEITGYVDGGMQAWAERGYRVAHTRQYAPKEAAARIAADDALRVLDVRSDEEWNTGHICGATHVMAGLLPERAAEFAGDTPLAVVCGTGYRSTVAASVLERAGARSVISVAGGMTAWHEAGLPVCGEGPPATPVRLP